MHPVYLEDLQQACFEYFKLGGAAVSGPVGLLSVYVELTILLLKLILRTVYVHSGKLKQCNYDNVITTG